MTSITGFGTNVFQAVDGLRVMSLVASLEAAVLRGLEQFQGKPEKTLSALIGIFLTYQASKVVHRLWLHPLRRFPGPFLGRISTKYEMFYDMWRDGEMESKFERDLHPKYGRIVRYSPNRLRVQDPDAWFELYKQTSTLLKDHQFYFNISDVASLFTVAENAEHRTFNPSFSKQRITKAEPMAYWKLKKMVEVMDKIIENAEMNGEEPIINMQDAMMSVGMDTFSQLCFGQDLGALNDPAFQHPMVIGLKKTADNVAWNKHTRAITVTPQKYMPVWLAKIIYPSASATKEVPATIKAMVQMHVERYKRTELSHAPEHFTILKTVLDDLDPNNLSDEFYDDMFVIFGASFPTSAMVLAHTFYYLSVNKDIQKTLFEELRQIMPARDSPVKYNELEHLPYLTGVIKEGLRTSNTVLGGLPRVVPEGGIEILGYHVPEGTVIEHSINGMHFNAEVFENPHKFDPNRWLGDKGKELNRYLVPFGGGNRICLGMYMGWMQVYMSLATVVRKFEISPGEELKQKGLVIVDRWVGVERTDMSFVVKKRNH